ncbi:MAG: ATP-dependent 6-phosphofructokinase [Fuerstiella sp.]
MFSQNDFVACSLGHRRFLSPVSGGLVTDGRRIRYNIELDAPHTDSTASELSLEMAGPREAIFFDPPQSTAAIVTCGGLSPGLNNVIRSVFGSLHYNYGVPVVLGIRNGYQGLNPSSGLKPMVLTHDNVEDIDKLGGTVLGTSRGPQDPAVTVEALVDMGVDMLFCVGGDGTLRGAHAIHEEIARRQQPIAVVGIPKTIDNDIPFVWHSFGYATALERAAEVIKGAHVEARSVANGISLVKLMGRNAGFIAAGATLTSQEVNFTLVPEVSFSLDGQHGLLTVLETRIRNRGHAVIVVAEGAGQHLFTRQEVTADASGNTKFHDIGPFLKDRILQHFQNCNLPVSLKYLDPSYYIRSTPANTQDRILCYQMGRYAVDAAIGGRTDIVIGHVHNEFVHVPIATAVREKKQLNTDGNTWRMVVRETSQPDWPAADA